MKECYERLCTSVPIRMSSLDETAPFCFLYQTFITKSKVYEWCSLPSDVSLRFPVCRASEVQTPANAEVLRLEAPSLFHQRARSVILSEAQLMLNSLLIRREGKSWLELVGQMYTRLGIRGGGRCMCSDWVGLHCRIEAL